MKCLLGVALTLAVLFSAYPVMAKQSSIDYRGVAVAEFLDDSLSGTTKFEGEIELTLRGDFFTLFTRFGNDWPFPYQEKGPELMKRYIALDFNDIGLTLGDYSIVLGRGIVLSATEDEALGRDSMLDGMLFEYEQENWDTTFFYGQHKSDLVNDFPTGVNTTGNPDRLWGGCVDYDFGDLDVGVHYLDSYIADDFEEYKDAFMGFDVALNILDWRLLYEHDFRDTYQAFDDGRASYAEISGGWPGVAVTCQYKDYWNMVYPYGAPPRLRRGDCEEASINANDEKGYMTTVVYNPDFLGESYLTVVTAGSEDTRRTKPFHEFFIEYQHDPLMDTTFSFGYDYVKGALQSYNYLTAQYHDYILEVDHALENDSIHLHLRYTEIEGDLGVEQEKEVGIDYNLGADLTLSLFYETSTKEYEPPPLGSDQPPGKSPGDWFAFKGNYDVTDDMSIELLWGSKRGGFECSGGTCAQLPAFKGVQLILKHVF